MEPDFEGWATRADTLCTDGRTIKEDAFKHQSSMQVPLVWQHGHADPENVLGHAILENRVGGVWTKAFFNDTAKAQHAKSLVAHKDITQMSIWANQLTERAKQVYHGVIREVSLVLAGANPGATIENVTIRHSADELEILDDEAIIYSGEEIRIEHMDNGTSTSSGKTIEEVYNSMNEEQKKVLHFMVGQAMPGGDAKHAALDIDIDDDATVQEVYDSMTSQQQDVMHYFISEALESSNNSVEHSALDENGNLKEGSSTMRHNVFENTETNKPSATLSHDDLKSILEDAESIGSMKKAVERYAKEHLAHGITDIDTLFPEAVSLDASPQYLARRQEWVQDLLSSVRKSPFSRIKTVFADITMDEARAKGYIKGTLKEEEFFSVSKRTTDPTTIYKKQELDRDDVIDITEIDVIVWLKAEMRLMLDEEIARAILMGDGRGYSASDKINEQSIRPIAKDHELFVTTLYVNLDDANSSITEVIDRLVENRRFYKGTGLPNLYCAETLISKFLLLKDTLGRRIYKSLQEVADELRVARVIPVEAMEEEADLVAVIFNPVDYNVGATAGGQVTMFDDFDIDFNKQKYLIETRMSGCLTRLKSALVVRKVAAANVLVAPTEPEFNPATGQLTIPTKTGVVYKNEAGMTINAAGSPYTVGPGQSYLVEAVPAANYYFETTEGDSWIFTADPA